MAMDWMDEEKSRGVETSKVQTRETRVRLGLKT